MTTNYEHEIDLLIRSLEFTKEQDLNDEANRHHASGVLFKTHKNISSPEEKHLSTWLLNASGDLELLWVLDKDHPSYKEDAAEFKREIEKILVHLKQVN